MFDEFLRQLRLLRRLIFPLPPTPRSDLRNALVLISAYAGFTLTGLWFGWPAGGAFVPAYGLLLVHGIPFAVLWRLREKNRIGEADSGSRRALRWAVPIANLRQVLFTAGLLVWGTPVFCQYAWLAALLWKASEVWLTLWAGGARVSRISQNVPEKISDRNMRLWMQWHTVRCVALMVIAVAAMRFGTLDDWIAMRALAPIATYYLFHWTLRATWDHGSVRTAGGND